MIKRPRLRCLLAASACATALSVGALTTTASAASAANTSTGTQSAGHPVLPDAPSIGHAPTGLLHAPNGMVALSQLLSANSPELPTLPQGEHYAPHVLLVQEIQEPTAPATSPSAVIPNTASGCTPFLAPHTCISVVGSGLKATYWTTGVNLKSPPSNPEAFYLVNGEVRDINEFFGTDASGFQWDPFGYLMTFFNYTNNIPDDVIFANNTKVCNRWTGAAVTTLPCETIHA